MCLMRKAPVNNIIEVAFAALLGIIIVECFPEANYTYRFKREYDFDHEVTSVAVVEEGKSLIFSE
jgi:hypothetical protein